MQIGIAGTGKIGMAIAQRLVEGGHEVAAGNRTADKLDAVAKAGAATARTPAELAQRSQAIITMLTDAAAIDAVYSGTAALLAGDVAGELFMEMSTVDPRVEVALAEKVRAKGAAFVECWLDRSGAARQADRSDGRRACRCRVRRAAP